MELNYPVNTELKGSQLEAFNKLKAWYNDKNNLCFTLKGYAGTGKTFLLKYFIDNVVRIPVCVTAPTHKAVKVVEKATGKPGKTLQSLHGLRPNVNLDNFNTNNIRFDTIGTEHMRDYGLVIIDECGQIGKALYELNKERSTRYKTKILYVGDPCQLPPINERLSKTFTDVPTMFELTEIIRQEAGNPLLEVLGMLRKDIVTQGNSALNYVYTKKYELNEKNQGFIKLNAEQFNRQLLDHMLSDEFSKDIAHAKYSAWTNRSINAYNSFIRHALLDTNEILDVNDLLTGYKTIVDEFNDPIITNSEDYIIKDISKRMSEHEFMTYTVLLYAMTSGTTRTITVVDHNDESYGTYYAIIKALQQFAVNSDKMSRGKNWKKYFAFKDQYITLQDISIPVSETKTDFIPRELDYGYGLTVHKLQGSTIHNMFINVLDITCYNGDPKTPIRNSKYQPFAIELRNKLLYTALSRARDKVFLLF
jgi:exodeoxyribonuclease-5